MSGRPFRCAALTACALTIAAAGCASSPDPQQIQVMNEREIRRERIEVALDAAERPEVELENQGEKTLHVDLVSNDAGSGEFAYLYLDATETGWNAAHQDFAACWTEARRQSGAIGAVETLMRRVDVNGLKACLDARGYEGAFFAAGEHVENGAFENAAQARSLAALGLRGVEAGAASAPAAARTPAAPVPAPAPEEAPYLLTAEISESAGPRAHGGVTGRRPGLAAPADSEIAAAPAEPANPVADPMADLLAALEAERAAAPSSSSSDNADYVPVISDTPIDIAELDAATAAPAPPPIIAPAAVEPSSPAPAKAEAEAPIAVAAGPVAPRPRPAAPQPAEAAGVWAEAEPAGADAPSPSMFATASGAAAADHEASAEMMRTAAVEPAPQAPAHQAPALQAMDAEGSAARAADAEVSMEACAAEEGSRRRGWSRFVPGRGNATEPCADEEAAAPSVVAAAEPPVAPAPPAPPTAPAAPAASAAPTGDKPRPMVDQNLPTLEELLGERPQHPAREHESTRGVIFVPLEG